MQPRSSATCFGAVCLALIYLALLSPDSLNYDSTWTHVVIAQDYAREGRIVPFIGNWPMNVPNLASIVDTWCFLVPGLGPHDAVRWMLVLHTELTIFLWTLVVAVAGVEWLVGERVRGAWASYFLLPSIFIYDGSTSAGRRTTILGLFVIGFCLAATIAARRFDPLACALAGALGAGGFMTKLQAIYVLAAGRSAAGVLLGIARR